MIPPRMVLLQLLQVWLSCACLLAAAIVSFLERCNALVLWWWCIQVLWHDDTRGSCWSAWISVCLLECLKLVPLIISKLQAWSWHSFFLSTMKDRKKERKKERLNERKKTWMICSLYGTKISWEKLFLSGSRSLLCTYVDLGCKVFLGNKFLFTKLWWCSRLRSYTMYDLWGWVCGFLGFAGTVGTNDTNSQPSPTVWWIWGTPAANLYWLDNVNQAAVLFVCCGSFLLSNIELERWAELCCVYDMTSVQVPDEAVCTSLLQIVLFGDRVILGDPIETWALQIAMLSSVQFPDHVQFLFLVGGVLDLILW